VYLLAKVTGTIAAGGTKTINVQWGNAGASSVSSLATTIGPTSSQTGPTDFFTQSDVAGYADGHLCVQLQYQVGGNASHNGDIICFHIAGKTSNGNYTGAQLYQTVTTDNGANWTKTQKFATGASIATIRGIGELLDGTILIAWTYGTVTNTNNGKVPLYIAKSTDAGATWSNFTSSPTNQLTVPWTVGTDVGTGYGRIRQLTSGGAIYFGVYGAPSAAPRFSGYLLSCPGASDPTNGSNWSQVGTPFTSGTYSLTEFDWCTTSSNSNMIAVSRCNNSPYDLFYNTSTDGGATWGTPTAMGFVTSGAPPQGPDSVNNLGAPCLQKLPSGNYALVYYDRTGTTFGSVFRVSTDGGSSFQNTPSGQILKHAPSGADARDFGNPWMTPLADGRLFCVHYHSVGSGLTNLEYAIVDEDYLFNGGNAYSNCNAMTAPWTTTTNDEVSIDTSVKLTGTGSILIDNSVGTSTNNFAIANLWPDGGGGATKFAMTYWGYIQQQQQNQVAIGISIQAVDGTSSTFQRISSAVFDDTSGGVTIHWYNGSHTDTNVGVSTTEWTRLTYTGTATLSTIAAKIAKNGTDTAASVTQYQSGSFPNKVRFTVGSTSSTNARKSNIGLVYSHQYTPTPPTVTVGASSFLGVSSHFAAIAQQHFCPYPFVD